MKIKLYALISIIILTLPIFSVSPIQGTELNKNSIISEISEKTTIEGDGKEEHWALLVAVGVYAEHYEMNIYSMLDETDNLYNTLLKSPCWSEDHIKVIKGEDATLSNIIAGLRWLDKMEDEDDISLVYINTHGGRPAVDIPPRDEADGRDEILVTYWGFAFPSINLLDDHLNFLLNRLESKGTCLIVDSCFAGGFNDPPFFTKLSKQILGRDNAFSASRWTEDFGRETRGKGRVVLMSSREDQSSYAYMFSPYLIDALKGFADFNHDNIVTAEEVYNYTKQRIPKWLQNPTIYDDYDGELPLIEISGDQINNDEGSVDNNIENLMLPTHISIESLSSENSIVCGYITDAETNEPIVNANVYLFEKIWTEEGTNYSTNMTVSDNLGFYFFDVVAGEIQLAIFTGGYYGQIISYFNVSENEILWINASLISLTENSIVCGYVKDNITNDPIQNAKISLYWKDNQGNYSINYTNSDLLGFYSMNVAQGEIKLSINADGYYNDNWPESGYYNYNISGNETKWVNISLKPIPSENSVVKGYITDFATGDPIENVYVELNWKDNQGHYEFNDTYTDALGFYSMNVAQGEIKLSINADGYYSEYFDWTDIDENEILWINISLNSSWDYIVCGYVKDGIDNLPIENASIELDWKDVSGGYYENDIYSDESGFYSTQLRAEKITLFYAEAEGYFSYSLHEGYEVGGEEVIWFNVSMIPLPLETSKVSGSITDSETDKPIENAEIRIYWTEKYSDVYYNNNTKSDESGFYSINVAPGLVGIWAEAEGYFPGTNYIAHEIGEYTTFWENLSLNPIPPKNAIVCGYITDVVTKEPIKNNYVTLNWRDFDDDNKHDWNDTITDSNGFYSMNVAEGKIYINVDGSGYYLDEYSELTNIYQGEILWINLSMYTKPPANSVVCGYIADADTHEPLADASVDFEWIGCEWHHISGSVNTDEHGYYSANVSAGEIYLNFYAEGHQYQKIGREDVGENGILWYNISLNKTKKIEVEIIKPLKAIYKNDKTALPFKKSLVFGNITIEAIVWYCTEENIDRVEFYIDGKLKSSVTSMPWYEWYYTWTRDRMSIFGHKHTIKVVAYDKDGNSASDEITVWKFG